jgi:hypothetical protein
MLDCISRFHRVIAIVIGVVLFTVAPTPIQAAQGGKVLGPREVTEKEWQKNKEQFNKLLTGEITPELPRDKTVLNAASQYLVYRVTWPTLQADKWESGMGKVQAEFEKAIDQPATKELKNTAFMKLFAHELIACLKKVLEQKYEPGNSGLATNVAVSNAALMLPVLARCKQSEVADFLIELAKTDPQGNPAFHPFVRTCAIKGLGELSAPGGMVDGDAKAPAAKGGRELACAEAIMRFIDAPYPPQGNGPEHKDAVAFVRREGVKALARIQSPAFAIKDGKVQGPVAYYLLKVASGQPTKADPQITLPEKLDAAIGLCNLKPGQGTGTPQVNGELTAFVVANVLVDFAEAYRADYPLFTAPTKTKDAPRPQAILPWKVYAQQLEAGLNTLAATLPKEAAAKVKTLANSSKKMLDDIGARRQIDAPQIDAAALQPANSDVYLGSKEYSLTLQAK